MVDVNSLVFTTLYNQINHTFQGVDVKDEYIDESSTFPVVTITEDSNTDYQKTMVHSWAPHAKLMYSINIYTNSKTKKTDARKLLNCIDNTMHGMKFIKTFCRPTPNVDRTIYRITARYEAVVEEPKITAKGDRIFQVYRQ